MSRGVFKIESEVFHFPKFDDPVLSDGTILTDHYKPHPDVGQPAGGPSLTRQDAAADCDINVIMSRYENTGTLPAVTGEPYYADFTTAPMDLQSAIAQLADAQDAFMTLPARVRREFDNDAARFVEFAGQPANLDQMREWGLAPPKPATAAPGAAVAPASASSPPVPATAPAAPAAATHGST